MIVGKIKEFVNEVVAEMKKVSWPTKDQLKESTTVVIIVSAIITTIVFLIDQAMTEGMSLIF